MGLLECSNSNRNECLQVMVEVVRWLERMKVEIIFWVIYFWWLKTFSMRFDIVTNSIVYLYWSDQWSSVGGVNTEDNLSLENYWSALDRTKGNIAESNANSWVNNNTSLNIFISAAKTLPVQISVVQCTCTCSTVHNNSFYLFIFDYNLQKIVLNIRVKTDL